MSTISRITSGIAVAALAGGIMAFAAAPAFAEPDDQTGPNLDTADFLPRSVHSVDLAHISGHPLVGPALPAE
ncbi:hypothetical protein FZI91_10470 [Mycobacterium sp. CBMA271]|uniref:hypothetical protein n=1 Tax=unclassified Mycobacteroides TaxID=2618759 RepID=UPI0012DC8515|nr:MULTISPECIES: hypothetical protein [unclassified Mycobacteroides]MUM16567.1 hypothetical protein [Mycobacteroides sp. CBMA 326]MUM22126.1 hypothetical protein [Mycobacteroides sp. CBMA 271]